MNSLCHIIYNTRRSILKLVYDSNHPKQYPFFSRFVNAVKVQLLKNVPFIVATAKKETKSVYLKGIKFRGY